MWCMGTRSSLQLHVVVDRSATPNGRGSILCIPHGGTPPFEFDWSGPEEVQTSMEGSQALDVLPGRYHVRVVDRYGSRGETYVRMEPGSAAVVVEGYRTTPTTTSSSRDGAVEAIGTGLENATFLWSNGIQTNSPQLLDVGCGTYCATAVPRNKEDGFVTVHACAPVVVSPKEQ